MKLKRKLLASKNDIANFVKKTNFNNKLKDVTSKENELNELSKKVKAIPKKGLTKDLIDKLSILDGGKYFSSGIFQNYLVLVSAKKYFIYFSGTTRTELWKSSRMSAESIENITKSESNFSSTFVDHQTLISMDTV